jgi:hypothetical protein
MGKFIHREVPEGRMEYHLKQEAIGQEQLL